MEVIVTTQFEKDVKKGLSKSLQIKLANTIEHLQRVKSFHEISHTKKLKGYKNAYRIKLNEYRIGFLVEENVIKLSRVMHRKEIYRYFP
ncbi:MAG: type II toxin-antitoxin system RelE/ParE family toxin [Bacteroidota bacterium]|nr:type II toxin-antitoxin system RelE/ParE family toxin [Bacteroidota bacterium]